METSHPPCYLPWRQLAFQSAKRQDIDCKVETKSRKQTRRLTQQQDGLRATYVQTVTALAEAVEAKDTYTRGHSERVGIYASKIAGEMGYTKEFIERVYTAGLLHDVGKIGVRDSIITKPDCLTPREYEEIKKHSEIGAKILERFDFLADIAHYVRHHHEWFDGSRRGYPDRLRGDQIPLTSRIILVADTVEAMTSDRTYRKAQTLDRVVAELNKYVGHQFDPTCTSAFLRLLEREGDSFINSGHKFDIYEFAVA